MQPLARIILPIVILGLSAGGFTYLHATRPKATPKPPQEKVWTVSAIAARYTDEQPSIREFGTVVAAGTVELRPLVAGRVVEVGANFVDGAIVRRGEMLLVIDPFEYEIAAAERRATLAEARAKLKETRAEIKSEGALLGIAQEQRDLRQRDLRRKRALRALGSTSRKAEDDALLAVNEATRSVRTREQVLERLKARLEQLKAAMARSEASLKRAVRDLAETRLTAPFDGFLTSTRAAVGQRVGANDRVARLIDASRLEVSFQLTQPDFARLVGGRSTADLIGKPVRVRWRVGADSFNFTGVIERTGAEIDRASGGINIYARIRDVGLASPLRPGAFVEVDLPDREFQNVLRLPGGAVTDNNIVYVVEDGRLAPHRIRVLRRVGGNLLARAEVPPGAQIVTTPFPEMGRGVRVRVR